MSSEQAKFPARNISEKRMSDFPEPACFLQDFYRNRKIFSRFFYNIFDISEKTA